MIGILGRHGILIGKTNPDIFHQIAKSWLDPVCHFIICNPNLKIDEYLTWFYLLNTRFPKHFLTCTTHTLIGTPEFLR